MWALYVILWTIYFQDSKKFLLYRLELINIDESEGLVIKSKLNNDNMSTENVQLVIFFLSGLHFME